MHMIIYIHSAITTHIHTYCIMGNFGGALFFIIFVIIIIAQNLLYMTFMIGYCVCAVQLSAVNCYMY